MPQPDNQTLKITNGLLLQQREMAPLDTGNGPFPALLTARVLQSPAWISLGGGVCGGELTASEQCVYFQTSWSQQDVDKLEQVQSKPND